MTDAAPYRAGVVVLDPKSRTAFDVLKFLLLQMNSLQRSIEFELLPTLEDVGFEEFQGQHLVPWQGLPERLDAVSERYRERLVERRIVTRCPIVVVSEARLDNHYLVDAGRDLTLIADGNWADHFARPPVVELMLAQVIRSTVISACGGRVELGHRQTRACLFDFVGRIPDARFFALSGHICTDCATAIRTDRGDHFLDDVLLLMRKEWLGSSQSPGTPAAIAKKMGYDQFYTAGFEPSFVERSLSILHEEGLKTVITLLLTFVVGLLTGWLITLLPHAGG